MSLSSVNNRHSFENTPPIFSEPINHYGELFKAGHRIVLKK